MLAAITTIAIMLVAALIGLPLLSWWTDQTERARYAEDRASDALERLDEVLHSRRAAIEELKALRKRVRNQRAALAAYAAYAKKALAAKAGAS